MQYSAFGEGQLLHGFEPIQDHTPTEIMRKLVAYTAKAIDNSGKHKNTAIVSVAAAISQLQRNPNKTRTTPTTECE